jgi:hypothetical protein|nr:MAG TPA: hypothetical protein [Bacteriophage sp.]
MVNIMEWIYSTFHYRTANKIVQALIKYFGSRNKKELELKNFNILLDRMVNSIKE